MLGDSAHRDRHIASPARASQFPLPPQSGVENVCIHGQTVRRNPSANAARKDILDGSHLCTPRRAGTSVMNMAHWAQQVRAERPVLAALDLGTDCVHGEWPGLCNQRRYGSAAPRTYPLDRIDVPLGLFSGAHALKPWARRRCVRCFQSSCASYSTRRITFPRIPERKWCSAMFSVLAACYGFYLKLTGGREWCGGPVVAALPALHAAATVQRRRRSGAALGTCAGPASILRRGPPRTCTGYRAGLGDCVSTCSYQSGDPDMRSWPGHAGAGNGSTAVVCGQVTK